MIRRFCTTAIRLESRFKPNGDSSSPDSLTEMLKGMYGSNRRSRDDGVEIVRATAPKVHLPPRTGSYVGRSVEVSSPEHLFRSIRLLNNLNYENQVNQTKRLQQFAERPGKARLRIQIARKRREFQEGIRRLWQLTNEARRKGY